MELPYQDQPRTYNADLSELVPRAKVFFYEVGTTIAKSAYAQADVLAPLNLVDLPTISYSVPLENPLTSDEAARLPAIFLDGDYRIYIEDEDGNELYDLDPFVYWPQPGIITPLSNDGRLLPFSTLTFYRSNTTMLETLSGDNPIEADENGEFPEILLHNNFPYRVILQDQYGRLIYDVDPIMFMEPE